MSRWLRFYDDAINDPKILKLPEALRWSWVAVLCIASKNNGSLPGIDDIALMLRVTPQKAASVLAALSSAGLLDRTEGGFAPHNWDGRQYKSDKPDETAAERMRKYREKKRVSSVTVTPVTDRNTVTVTVPRADTEQITDTEKKETRVAALDDGWPDDFRALFWNDWPHKVGKPKAMNELERLRRRGVPWLAIYEGEHRYIRTKPPDRPWLNPATFLHQERFNDQPAEVASGKSESLASVAKRQADAGISFGERPTGLRVIARGDDVRLLPEAGRERPGNLRGGGNGDPVGISGFGD